MGVTGLWDLVQPVGHPILLETLEGKIIAVDISIWLNQAVKGFRDRTGQPVPNAHVLGLFHRICKLLFYKIKPVFIFDGSCPAIKRRTIEARFLMRDKTVNKSRKAAKKIFSLYLSEQLGLSQEQIEACLKDQKGSLTSHLIMPSTSSSSGFRRIDADEEIFKLPSTSNQSRGESSQSDIEFDPSNRSIQLEDEFENSGSESSNDSEPAYFPELDSIDITSNEFKSLPPEIKLEMLNDLKERSKRRFGYRNSRRTNQGSSQNVFHDDQEELAAMPSDDFASSQLKRILKKNEIQKMINNTKREIEGSMPSIRVKDGTWTQFESQRIYTDSSSQFVLLKRRNQMEAEKRLKDLEVAMTSEDVQETKVIDQNVKENCKEISSDPIADIFKSMVSQSSQNASKEGYKPKNSPTKPKTVISLESDDEKGVVKKAPPVCSQEELRKILDSIASGSEVAEVTLDSDVEELPSDSCDKHASSTEKDSVTARSGVGRTLETVSKAPLSCSRVESQDSDAETIPDGETQGCDDISSNNVALLSEKEQAAKQKAAAIVNRSWYDPYNEELHFYENDGGRISPIGVARKDVSKSLVSPLFVGSPDPVLLMSDSGDSDSESMEGTTSEIKDQEQAYNAPHSKPHYVIDLEKKDYQTIQSDIPQPENSGEKGSSKEVAQEVNRIGSKSHLSPSDDARREMPADSSSSLHISESTRKSSTPIQTSRGVATDDTSPADSIDTSASTVPQASPKKSTSSIDTSSAQKASDTSASTIPRQMSPRASSSSQDEVRTINLFPSRDDLMSNPLLDPDRDLLIKETGKHDRFANTVTDKMISECQELLNLFGVPYLVAPEEAESQAAALEELGLTQGTITDDSDIWLFGGKTVYKNFFTQAKYVELYKSEDIKNHFFLDRDGLICFALLTGSDYTEGVPGIGGVTAYEILSEFKTNQDAKLNPLVKFKEWLLDVKQKKSPVKNSLRAKFLKFDVPEHFPSMAVYQAYLQPNVDLADERFSWSRPDLDLLRQYARHKFAWPDKKTDDILLPVIKKQLNQASQVQSRIDQFFKPASRIPHDGILGSNPAHESKRLTQAIEKMRRRLGSGNDKEVEHQSDHSDEGQEDQRKKPKAKRKASSSLSEERTSGPSKSNKPRGQKRKPGSKSKGRSTRTKVGAKASSYFSKGGNKKAALCLSESSSSDSD